MYTGYLYENLIDPNNHIHTEYTDNILDKIDVLVDGPFKIEEKDLRLRLKGSRNQRIIDIPETRKTKEITIWRG